MYGYGAWVGPGGEVRYVGYQWHAQDAAQVVKSLNLKLGRKPAYAALYQLGWVRVIFLNGLTCNFYAPLTPQQMRVMKEFVAEETQGDPQAPIRVNDVFCTGKEEAWKALASPPPKLSTNPQWDEPVGPTAEEQRAQDDQLLADLMKDYEVTPPKPAGDK